MPAPAPPQLLEVLTAALERLGRSRRWTRGAQARLADGRPTRPEEPEAFSFCAFGVLRREALARAAGLGLAEQASRCLATELWRRGLPVYRSNAPRTVMEWNDAPGRTQLEVLDLYRQAIHSLLSPPPDARP